MGYSADTFVADEVPTTSKMNKLWSNDASFNDGSGLNAIANAITAATGNHLTLTPAANKLVKFSGLRQNQSTNTYETNTVILTGFRGIEGNATAIISASVSFGITFDAAPIVICGYAAAIAGSAPTVISDLTAESTSPHVASSDDVTTTGFTMRVHRTTGTMGAGTWYSGAWIAIGKYSS